MPLPHVAWVRTALLSLLLAAAPGAWSDDLAARASTASSAGALSARTALLLPSPAGPGLVASPQAAAAATAPTSRQHHLLGLQLDGGLPDFAGVSVLYRPWRWLRLSGGMLYDYAGYGVRAGVGLVPFNFPIAPSLNLEAGRLFEANAAAKVAKYADLPDDVRPLLERFGYTFANLQLGIELGHPNRFIFFIRAGVSRMWLTVHGMSAAMQASNDDASTRVTASDAVVRLGVPSAKAGFMIFFW